jgi:hypothetical protein
MRICHFVLLVYFIVEGCGRMVTSLGLVLYIQEVYALYRSPSVVRVVQFIETWYDGSVAGIDTTEGGAV